MNLCFCSETLDGDKDLQTERLSLNVHDANWHPLKLETQLSLIWTNPPSANTSVSWRFTVGAVSLGWVGNNNV